MQNKILLLGISMVLLTNQAKADILNDQLNAMKTAFMEEFNNIDTNADEQISKDEFIAYKFSLLQKKLLNNIEDNKEEQVVKQKIEPAGISPALKEMAEYKLDFEDEELLDDDITTAVQEIENTLKSEEDSDNEVKEESLKELLNEIKKEDESTKIKQENEQKEKDKKMSFLLSAIKTTLPKKIDDITTWTDINYKDNKIIYTYKADIDTTLFTKQENELLQDSIKNEACHQAYESMCSTIKPMFIDKGTNMEIQYHDKDDKYLSSCLFNNETCL